MQETTCCFIGHRKIQLTEELQARLYAAIERLIQEGADTFLLGSDSAFNDLCHQTVTALQKRYPAIRRIYVRAKFPDISEDYKRYLLESYEDTYFPERVAGAGRAAYVVRNQVMIQASRYCVFYCDPACAPTTRPSGTLLALAYAKKLQKEIVVLP